MPADVRTAVAALLGALALDLAFGDPPNRWHPVAWMGAAVSWGRRRFERGGRIRLLIAGAALTLCVVVLAGAVAAMISMIARGLGAVGVVIEAVALAALLSVRGLARAARTVGADLACGDLAAARASVAFHLVSRPTGELDEPHVLSATIESVAENLGDSVLAPVAFYLAFGLPGAAIYRAVNTADAMIGYREGALEHFGKLAARLDDLLSFVPARLAALAIVAGAALARGDARLAWRVMRRDARRTASPNAGWPMAAMAGALDRTLEKVDAYRLGDGPPPSRVDIDKLLAIFAWASAVGIVVLVAARVTASSFFFVMRLNYWV